MKKLFLTSFVFKTGGTEYKEQRLVIASNKAVQEYHRKHPDEIGRPEDELDIAYFKARKWFEKDFPESELISLIVHPAIE